MEYSYDQFAWFKNTKKIDEAMGVKI